MFQYCPQTVYIYRPIHCIGHLSIFQVHNVFIVKLLTFCWFTLLCLSFLHWTKQVKHQIKISMKFAQAYELFFGVKTGDQDNSWIPHIVCGTCWLNLEGGMEMTVLQIWKEPQNHVNDCFFWMVEFLSFEKKKNSTYHVPRYSIIYCSSSILWRIVCPRPHAKESERENFESQSKISFIGHSDKEKKQPHFLKPAGIGWFDLRSRADEI